MKKSIPVNQNKKRGPGRPPSGRPRDPLLAFRVPKPLKKRVERAVAEGEKLSDTLRRLVEKGLEATGDKAKR
jgi:hypothetical protein